MTYKGTTGKAKKQFKAIDGKYLRKIGLRLDDLKKLNIPESVAEHITRLKQKALN